MAFEAGGYSFIPGVFQYSGGVVASPGYRIERVRLRRPLPIDQGFDLVERTLEAVRRPSTAFCACEIRSPGQFTESGFRAFNERYVERLERWDIFRDGTNPVARSNVCPEIDAPDVPSLYAFSFTIEDSAPAPSFIVAGSAEAPEGTGSYRDNAIRPGETGPQALAEKARFVLGEMERRLAGLGHGWADTTATQVYTVFDLHPFFASEIVRRGAAAAGLSWHYCRPPVERLDYEMDCRAVPVERVV